MKKIAIVFFLLVGITLGVGVLKFGVQDGIKINVMASLCALENRSHNNLMPEGLPVYEIEIDEDQWDELLADLPESGRDKKKVVFKHEGKAYKAKMKTRGHLKLHWGGHKKSIRVYFKGKSPFGTINQMNFIKPKIKC